MFKSKQITILAAAMLLLPGAALALSPQVGTADAAPVQATGPAAAVLGVWTTPHDKSRVRIYRAPDGSFQGRIIWLKQPDYPANYRNKALAGKPKVDIHNPKKALRSRRVLGLVTLTGFRYSPRNHDWRKGKCYDPESGKTYTCRMWLKNPDTLMVRGYVWIFHKTQTWHRYTAPAATAPTAATSR